MAEAPAGWYGMDLETMSVYGPGQGRLVVLNDMARHGVVDAELVKIDRSGSVADVVWVNPMEATR